MLQDRVSPFQGVPDVEESGQHHTQTRRFAHADPLSDPLGKPRRHSSSGRPDGAGAADSADGLRTGSVSVWRPTVREDRALRDRRLGQGRLDDEGQGHLDRHRGWQGRLRRARPRGLLQARGRAVPPVEGRPGARRPARDPGRAGGPHPEPDLRGGRGSGVGRDLGLSTTGGPLPIAKPGRGAPGGDGLPRLLDRPARQGWRDRFRFPVSRPRWGGAVWRSRSTVLFGPCLA